MNQNRTKSLLRKLNNYEQQNQLLQELNFSSTQFKTFKKYYTEMYIEFVEFVKKEKNKEFSEKGKSLKQFSDIFGKTIQLLQLLALTVFFSIFSLVYLFYLEKNIKLIFFATFLAIVLVSVLFRHIQKQSTELTTTLNKNGKVIEDLHMIISKQQKIA